jgi:iron complex outermembrane receptor protein
MNANRLIYPASTVMLAAALTLGGRAADAQTAPPPAPAGATAPATAIGEVVITAQKRSERVVNVPISIAAFSRTQLEQRNITSNTGLQSITPGLRMDQTGVFAVPTIRGIGTPVTGSGASPTAIYIDGIYQQDAAGDIFDLDNVSSVQILKGPQGTLFGRNSEGGAILVDTLDPTSTPTIRALGSLGSYNERKANVYLGGPLVGDTLLGNIDIYARHNDGYLHNIYTGSRTDGQINTVNINSKILYRPTDRLSFTLKLTHDDMSDASAANYVALVDPATGKGYATANAIPGAIVATSPYTTANDQKPANRVIQSAVSLKSVVDFDWATLTSYTSWIHDNDREVVDQDSSNEVLSEFHWNIDESSYQQEFDLGSHGKGKLDWVTGLYVTHDSSYDPGFYAQGGADSGHIFNLNTGTSTTLDEAGALFADVTYNIVPRLYLTVGGRYSIERKQIAVSNSATSPGENGQQLGHTWHAFTPRAVIRYQLTPTSNVYFSYSQGQKSGLFNTSVKLTAVAPEELTSYEVGFKASSARWHVELAAYHYNYDNLQFQNTIANVGTVTSNAGNAVSYGGEASVAYSVTHDLSLNVGTAYTHADYTSFKTAVIAIPNANDLGDTITPLNESGKEMIRAPRWTVSVGPDWRHDFGFGIIDLSGNYYWSSQVFFQADDAPYFSQKPYGVLDLRLAWSTPSEHYQIAVWGNNVTNTLYLNQASPDAASARLRYAAPSEFGVTISYKN